MKIYVAAPWVRKAEARQAAEALLAQGHEITSRWKWLHGESEDQAVLAQEAQNDIDDIHEADALVLLNLEKSEGKAVETGYALASYKPVIVLGGRSNIFHHLPRVLHVSTMDQLFASLKGIANAKPE